MNVVLRTPMAMIDTFDANALVEFALVTEGFTVDSPERLNFNHFPGCRFLADTGRTKHDFYSENLFCYRKEGVLFVFLEDGYKPFDQALKELPAATSRGLKKAAGDVTLAKLAQKSGIYGSINLANVVKLTAWQQVLDIAARYKPKGRK